MEFIIIQLCPLGLFSMQVELSRLSQSKKTSAFLSTDLFGLQVKKYSEMFNS